VAVKLDAEKEVDLAKRYAIGAYPTILLLKADGTEIDRIVGYKDADTFLADADAALAGKDSVTRAKEKLAGHENDPMMRQQYAKALAQKGRKEEALAEYLWCFDHGEESPGYGGVRLSFLLGDIAGMAKAYPPAARALEERRDAAEARLLAGSDAYRDVSEAVAINRTLKTPARTLAVFDKLKAQKPLTSAQKLVFMREVLPLLCEARRYDDALEVVGDTEKHVTSLIELSTPPTKPDMDEAARKQNEEIRALMRPMVVAQACPVYEALLAKDQKDVAGRVADRLIGFAPTGATYASLIQSAARAGATQVADSLAERGVAAVPEAEKDLVRRARERAADVKK